MEKEIGGVQLIYYILLHLILLSWTIFNSLSMPRLGRHSEITPSVAVLVPMRNEEKNVEELLHSLQKLTYKNLRFVILDDGSSDTTWEKLTAASQKDSRLSIHKGSPLPENWVGKVYACHQLSMLAEEEFLLFLDADVRVSPDLVQETLYNFKKNTGLVTGFPHIPLKSILGHLLIPMQHFLVFFHLPVLLSNLTTWSQASAAHGAFMMFRASAYRSIGGHFSVKNSLVEDIHIARVLKTSGWRVRLVNVTGSVSCHMYNTSKEVWEGFSKNFFPGLGRSLPAAILFIFFYTLVFLVPVPAAVTGVVTGNYLLLLPLVLTFFLKLTIDLITKQKFWLAFFFPLSVMAAFIILIYSISLSITKQGFTWKGRTYQ
jgi:cellulose synthase/poly-beta-1,6-N-acetylglucosamine synthase-like glycosyltransferase